MKHLIVLFIIIALLISASYYNFMNNPLDGTETSNSGYDMLTRGSGFEISKIVNITGDTNSYNTNVLQLTGTVLIVNQWAEITVTTDLTNMTGVYASLYDGTNTVNLTADGLVLSTATVGSFFTKDQIATEIYSSNIADQCRLLETVANKYAGRPFIITQKNATNTYIRFNYTTNTTLDITVRIVFEYIPLNGATLAFL